MAAMAALGQRLRELSRAVGRRGVQTPPGAPPEPPFTPHQESSVEFAFVERLLPPTRIPEPPRHPKYPTPSGWSPPAENPPALPYFVGRSRHHNLPVYERLAKGNRRLTQLRRLEGDLWALERDLRADLGVQDVQVNEVTGSLLLRGHCGAQLRAWLLQKGF